MEVESRHFIELVSKDCSRGAMVISTDVVEVECSTTNGTFKSERSIPAKEERRSGAAFGSAFGQLSHWFQDNASS